MATIDQLQIEISASSRQAESSIDKLIGSLKKLNTNLNLDFGNSLSASLSNLNTSLSNLSLTIDGFDSGKLKNIAGSFRSLSNLSNLTNKTSKNINKDVKSISSDATRLSQDLAKKFNITDAKGIKELETQFGELEKAIKGGLNTNAIEKSIESIVNTKQTAEEFVNQFNAATHGKTYSLDGNPADVLNQMVKDYDQIESDMNVVSESEYRNTGAAKAMAEAMANVKEQFRETKNESQGLAQSLGSIPNISEKITPVGGTDALEDIILNLRELSTLNLSAENISGITALANAMGKLGGKSATGAAASIKPIAEGLRMLPEVVPSGESYAQLANGLAKLGGVKVQSATGLTEVARGLERLKNLGSIPNISGLTELGQSLAVFGRQSAQNAVIVIPQLATAFRTLITTLSTAPRISQNVIDLANAMAHLTANTGGANRAVGRSSSLFSNLGASAAKAKKSFGGLAATIGKIYATYWLLFRAFAKVREAIGFGSALVEVQNVVDTVFGDAKDKVEAFADSAIMSFGLSELSAKKFASKYQAMGSAMGITNAQVVQANEYLDKALEGSKRKVDGYTDSYKNLGTTLADMSINMTKLTADISSFYNMDYDEVATKMASVWTGQTRPMREFGVDLTQTTLQEWMLNRGIDGNIKKMTQAEKTMIRYQYVMEQLGHTMNDYARTADTWANVTRTIGEQFRKLGGIIGAGSINAFRPALVKFRDFMNTLIDLVEKGLNAIGKLLGWQIEISDVGLAEDADAIEGISDGLGDAAGNAKKLNEQLEGFDKLNNIQTPKDNGGSGSGSGASGGGGAASKATDAVVTWKKYESDIETWGQLGSAISDKLSEAMEKIKWQKIYKKAENFGTDLADFMNGLFTGSSGERLFENLGGSIAGAINTVFTAWKAWADEFNFSGLGKAISYGIKRFLYTWKPDTTGWALGKTANGIANALYVIVSDKKTWKLLGKKIAIGINAFLASMNEEDPLTGKNGWEAMFGSVSGIVTGLGAAINEAIGDIEWNKMLSGFWDGLVSFFTNLDEDSITGFLAVAALSGVGRKIIGSLIKGLFADFIGSAGAATGLAGASATELIPAIAIPLTFYFVWTWGKQGSGETDSVWGTEKSNFKKAWDDMINSISNFFSKKGTATEWNGKEVEIQIPLKERLRIAKQEFKDFIHNNPPENIARNLWSWLQKTAKTIWDKFKEAWGNNKFVQVGIKLFEGALGLLWLGITNDWGVQKTLLVLLSYFDYAINKLWEAVQKKWSDKRELKVWIILFKSAIKTLWSAVTGDWDGVERNLKVGIDFAADALNSLWQKLVNYFTGRKVEIQSETTPEVKEPKKTSRHSGGTHTQEKGGAFYNGKWHNIAQFASGGRPSHGSMFIAGENGAEVVGHIGGRSEVLNESQMASVMYDAVSDAMATQNAILIKQNQLLSGILAKDYGISSSDIFAATQREANNYTMRTGRPAFS